VKQIVECIPNFSEGRRQPVIDAIVGSIGAVPGIRVLDVQSDIDHNRTVVTFVGEPQSVAEGAFQGISTAAQLIDLNHHQGEHPRIGRVALELDIPVYLYEEAATRPDRRNLAEVRRGEFEGLKEEILTNPDRAPDFGPARLGPAGATVIGARQFLIAYNVFLSTDDVDIARQIARAVRQSSGGLQHVKALGLAVEGRAQVSMNLTDFKRTPVHRVVELIRREASRYGVAVERSELIGLIPEQALIDAAQWYLQLDGFSPDQVLEIRLSEG